MASRKPFIANCSTDSKVSELIDPAKPVEVYKNLHRGCWSVRQSGIVRFHTYAIALEQCQFKVSESGRQRVLKEKRKNVHAFIKGIFIRKDDLVDRDFGGPFLLVEGDKVTYDPYTMSTFKHLGEPCHTMDAVVLNTVGVYELLEN
tara:strand:+ start:710 stop:1147 length:438 start_codon:yes stop_codon:yes gene_type:complete